MRQHILGCAVDNLSMVQTLDRIGTMIASGKPHQHVVINADKVVKAARDPKLADIIAAYETFANAAQSNALKVIIEA